MGWSVVVITGVPSRMMGVSNHSRDRDTRLGLDLMAVSQGFIYLYFSMYTLFPGTLVYDTFQGQAVSCQSNCMSLGGGKSNGISNGDNWEIGLD